MNDYSRIPDGLRIIPQWILWRWFLKKDGSRYKSSVNANGIRWNAHDQNIWMNFDTAIKLQELLTKEGSEVLLGFVLTPQDQIFVIDLDGCRNPTTGVVAEWTEKIVNSLASYTEVSPSGTGLKIFVCSTDEPFTRITVPMPVEWVSEKEPKLEIYTMNQFMAVTGQLYRFENIEERTEATRRLVAEYRPHSKSTSTSRPTSGNLEFQNNDDADTPTVDAARAFVLDMPAAVSGSGGHDATYAVACRLMIDFRLSFRQAIDIFEEWNFGCSPPWERWDLERKLREAGKLPGERGLRAPDTWIAKMVRDVAELQSRNTSTISSPSGLLSEDFVPFPVDILPKPLRTFINAVAVSIGCDPSFVALPVLVLK